MNTGKPQGRTTAQVIAADPDTSVWVSANAGTGKTQVLTDRITRLLLEGVRPQSILCLTFTKAAAAEMATRLSQRLGGWAVAAESDLQAEITALLGKPPEPALLARPAGCSPRPSTFPAACKSAPFTPFANPCSAASPSRPESRRIFR